MALEVFLQQVREHWEGATLDLINYRGKCSLVRGWDELFQKLTDHINSLAAMRISPYFRVFEAEAGAWDEKLNRLFALLDVWIDVQRRWVYLEGIFTGSAEIAQLLPVETQRFRAVNGEFLALMRRTAAQPGVLAAGAAEGAQRGLEKLLDALAKIQKALGEYLEKQRSAFPRFYFVGDEDLLEIIGAGKDVGKIQKHFKKMFAGVAAVQLTAGVAPEEARIEAALSAEGERLPLPEPFGTKDLKVGVFRDWQRFSVLTCCSLARFTSGWRGWSSSRGWRCAGRWSGRWVRCAGCGRPRWPGRPRRRPLRRGWMSTWRRRACWRCRLSSRPTWRARGRRRCRRGSRHCWGCWRPTCCWS